MAGDKFRLEAYLRQPRLTNSSCVPLTKHKELIQKYKETGDSKFIYQNDLDKAYYVIKAFNIVKNPKYDGYQKGLASIVWCSF